MVFRQSIHIHISEKTTMSKYLVTFEDHSVVLREDELLEFVKTAVIRNKDISSFSVQRVDSIPSQSAPHLSRESARIQVVEAAFFRIFNI